ncbi:hypothetical protein ACHAQH_009847 [Verticillium albo-atrum]
MATREVERYNKAVRRNIGCLLTKCEQFSSLGGMELALYISFPEDEGFVSYESANLNWRQDIEAKQVSVQNVRLRPLAGVLCGLGVVGTCWLWWKWQRNYVWLIAQVPGVSHSLVALFSVVISIATSQDGELSVTTKVSISIVSALCGIMIVLTVVYTKLLDNIITPYDKQVVR